MKTRRQQAGMTLVEMMIAMLIGTILVAGAITVYTQSKANYRANDSIARLQDNLRFALDTIEPDLRQAGFWGAISNAAIIEPNGVTVSCTGGTIAEATALAIDARATAVESRDDVYDLPCQGRVPRAGSDVLVLRHASQRITDPGSLGVGQVYAELNLSGGQLFDDAVPPAIAATAEHREVVVNAYYIGESSFDPATPALRRLSLVDGGAQGALQDQEVIPGVENLQVQFGLDSDGNGEVDRYVDGDHPLAAPGTPGIDILAVRIWMLVRSEMPESGFVDDRVYPTADADRGPIRPGADVDYPENFRRMPISKTVLLRNNRS